MPRWIFPFIIVLILAVILEIYTFQALKTISKSKFLRYGFLFISVAPKGVQLLNNALKSITTCE